MEKTQDIALEIYPRTKTGKSGAYRARVAGFIPAIIYGPELSKGGSGVNVNLRPPNFLKVYKLKGKSSIVSVSPQEGVAPELASRKFLFEAIQTHTLRNEVIHVDLHQLDLKKPVRVIVPLHFVGKAKGSVEGGILSILNREVEIKALPENIPSHIDVDVSDLGLNDSMKIEELAEKVGEGKFEFIYDSSFALVAVLAPEDEVAATPVAAAAEVPAAGKAAPAGEAKDGAKS